MWYSIMALKSASRVTPAAVVESADTKDLKSFDRNIVPVQVRSAAPKIYRGVEQLVARRAHNPKVVGSSPSPATMRKALVFQVIPRLFPILSYVSSIRV